MAKKTTKKTTPPEEKIEAIEPATGRVFDCVKLNVRKAPKFHADVVDEITCNSEVAIDVAESTDDFYKVTTANGVEGYCMKRYILETDPK